MGCHCTDGVRACALAAPARATIASAKATHVGTLSTNIGAEAATRARCNEIAGIRLRTRMVSLARIVPHSDLQVVVQRRENLHQAVQREASKAGRFGCGKSPRRRVRASARCKLADPQDPRFIEAMRFTADD